jgi:hypothetical protein
MRNAECGLEEHSNPLLKTRDPKPAFRILVSRPLAAGGSDPLSLLQEV